MGDAECNATATRRILEIGRLLVDSGGDRICVELLVSGGDRQPDIMGDIGGDALRRRAIVNIEQAAMLQGG
jgi:hypothetical protein